MEKIITAILALLSSLGVGGGCEPNPQPSPSPIYSYTVVRGQRVEKAMKVPCTLQFDITNFSHTADNDLLEEHLAWAVSKGHDWSGGNPPAGTYAASFKDYKLKVYGVPSYAGENRIHVTFEPSKKYTVKADITSEKTTMTILLGTSILAATSINAEAPEEITFGYGWPPTKRNGPEGAVITNVIWQEN